MNTRKLLFYGLTLLLGGCLPVLTLNPIYTNQDVIFEEQLLGTWTDDDSIPLTNWEFTRAPVEENEILVALFDLDTLFTLFYCVFFE